MTKTKMKVVSEKDYDMYVRSFAVIVLVAVLSFIGGMWFNSDVHPYDECLTMYTQPEEIIECVWLLSSNKEVYTIN